MSLMVRLSASVGLLANDFDDNGDSVVATPSRTSIVTARGVPLGSVDLAADGTFSIEPAAELVDNWDILPLLDPEFEPRGSFRYRIEDSTGRQAVGTATITFTKANRRPEIESFSVPTYSETNERVGATVEVFDADGDLLTITVSEGGVPIATVESYGGVVELSLQFTEPGTRFLSARVSDGKERSGFASAETVVLDGGARRTIAGTVELSDGSRLTLGARQNGGDIRGTIEFVTHDGDRYHSSAVSVLEEHFEGLHYLSLRGDTGQGYEVGVALQLDGLEIVSAVVFDVEDGIAGVRFFTDAAIASGQLITR